MAEVSPGKPLKAEDFDIETFKLGGAIEGSEGLDVNHLSRLRMQFLTSQHASIVTQIQFADAKAAALMTVMGLMALNGPVRVSTDASAPVEIFALTVFSLMILAVIFAMTAIIPRYPDAELNKQIKRRERYSWPALVAHGYEPLAHAEFMRHSEATQLIMSISQTNGAMAQVLQKKFRNLRIAFLLGGTDMALILGFVIWDRVL